MKSLLLAIALSVSLLKPMKAEALVGAIFAHRTVKTVGAVGAIGGGVITGTGIIGAMVTSGTWNALGWMVVALGGAGIAGIGLIILDDDSVLDIEFKPIDLNQQELFVTKEEIAIYNSEIDLLNMIRKTIISETDEEENTDDAEVRWLEYSDYLHPATFRVAQEVGKAFLAK